MAKKELYEANEKVFELERDYYDSMESQNEMLEQLKAVEIHMEDLFSENQNLKAKL